MNASTPDTKQPLGSNYLRLWWANAVSNLGDGVSIVAWPWLASLLTRDPFEIALIAAAQRLPWLLFSLPAGVITDRYDRRLLVMIMDWSRALLFMAIGFLVWSAGPFPSEIGQIVHAPGLYTILLLSAPITGMIEVLRDNSAQTLLPAIVPKSRLEAANSRMWAAESLTNSLIGPPLAGFIIAIALPAAFFLDAISFAISALLIVSLKGKFSVQEKNNHDWKRQIKDGLQFLWRNALLKNLAIALGLFNAFYNMMLISLVLYCQEVLGLSVTQYGILLTAAAIGGIVGGFVAENVIGKFGPARIIRFTLMASILELTIITFTSSAYLLWLVLMAGGLFSILWNTVTVSLRQRLIPDELLGRVNSAYRFFGWGMLPIGYLLGGAVVNFAEVFTAREIALRMPFALGAIAMALVTLFFWRAFSKSNIENAHFK